MAAAADAASGSQDQSTKIDTDICVIGAGAAGLSVAAGASQMGARVVLIEKHMRDGVMGGECLHTGCVPSKALLAAAKRAKAVTDNARFGIKTGPAEVDFEATMNYVRRVIDTISPIDSTERFQNLGVSVMEGHAQFIGPRMVEIEGMHVEAKFFVIATGSRPAVPPIPGLDKVDYLTNETVFDNRTLPAHLIIIGGGPIGMELAQAHRRLGAQVTVLERIAVLPNDEPDLRAVVKEQLISEGVAIHEFAEVTSVSQTGSGEIHVSCVVEGQNLMLSGSHLLVAAGRQPVVDGLGLEAAGVPYSGKGIAVDGRLRTANKKIFAIGDCADAGPRLTHVAGYHAGIVIRNALFRAPTKSNLTHVPAVTYTDPEIAKVGLGEEEARDLHKDVRVTTFAFDENDRAQAEGEPQGFIKVVARKNGKILGVSIVGAQAGELIQPWLMALSWGKKLSHMTGYIAPYPTLGEINKRVAGQFYTSVLFGPRVRSLVRLLLRLP